MKDKDKLIKLKISLVELKLETELMKQDAIKKMSRDLK